VIQFYPSRRWYLTTPRAVSCDNHRDSHGNTSQRDIRRHPLSYSGTFEEYPGEPGGQRDSSYINSDTECLQESDLPFTITIN